MTRRFRLLAALAVLGLVVAACGSSGKEPDQKVTVILSERGFDPPQLSFPVGTTVRFTFHNQGRETHEAVFGDEKEQDEHETMMKQQPHMAQHKVKGEHGFVEVKPGDTEELDHKFDKKGTILIACHEQPDHYARGEKITVTVT